MSISKDLLNSFRMTFKTDPEFYISSGGRLEILGNHTDHNHGLCIVANCSLRMKTLVRAREDGMVRVKSKGYKLFEFPIDDLHAKESEYKTSLAMAKGVLFKLRELGYKIGGFEAYIDSEIPGGAGVSSSAAFESLIGFITSYLYNDRKIDDLVIAKVGQFSENNYFHKPCGLLDQIGTSFRSCNSIDFKDIENPTIKTIDFNLPLSLYLINSEGNHSNLVDLYAGIPNGMYAVAREYGHEFLRDLTEEQVNDFKTRYESGELSTGEKEPMYRKAKHFFNENETVKQGTKALETNDVDLFLDAVRKSQDSSFRNIENTYVKGEYEGSPQYIIDVLSEKINEYGAIRIHGGGFKGSVLAFIKNGHEEEFEDILNKHFSKNGFWKVNISNNNVEYEEIK